MRFETIVPCPELAGIVEKIWVVDITGSLPPGDAKNIMPDGRAKLIIPYRNGLSSRKGSFSYRAEEGTLTLVGLTDTPAASDKSGALDSGMIVVQFFPEGLHRVLGTNLSDIRDQIIPFRDLMGVAAQDLEEQIYDEKTVEDKIARIQNYLVSCLVQTVPDRTLDFCVRQIRQARGNCRVKELEMLTGYGSRWLHAKFSQKVGMSPKHLAALMRFDHVYSLWAKGEQRDKLMSNVLDLYFDQSHFIHEFRKFTGMPPSQLERVNNEFGKLFYRG